MDERERQAYKTAMIYAVYVLPTAKSIHRIPLATVNTYYYQFGFSDKCVCVSLFVDMCVCASFWMGGLTLC
jgi:hypothetical protein